MSAPSVLIVDRHALVRRALRTLLGGDGDLHVVGEAADIGRALAGLGMHRPDVVLVGPGDADPSIIARLRAGPLAPRVVVVSDRPCRCGSAATHVPEEAPAHLLRAAVRGAPGSVERLSARERDVLRLVGLGYTNPEIAGRLGLSVRTVESHRALLARKLRATSRAQLVRHALDRGLVA